MNRSTPGRTAPYQQCAGTESSELNEETGRCFGHQEPQDLTVGTQGTYQVTTAVICEQVGAPEQKQGTVNATWQLARICLKLYERHIRKLPEIVGWQFAATGRPT